MEGEEFHLERQRILKSNVGTIVRVPEYEDERVRFSRSQQPGEHATVLEAAVWVRQDRPEKSSKYKTFISRSLESSRGRSVVNDGAYADDYLDAIEWVEEKSAEYGGERISWLDLPKKVVSEDEIQQTQSKEADTF